jgi:hypothetical protein
MYCTRSALIELIEQVDQIHVDSLPVITELIQWLPTSTIESFIEDAKAALELDYDRAEEYFFNEGVKAAEEANAQRVAEHLDLVQCSEV